MKSIVSILLVVFLLMACKKDEPAAASVVVQTAPKVTAETEEKVEKFFLYLGKVEAKLVVGNQKENLEMITGVVPELKLAERAVLRDLSEDDRKKWDDVVWEVRQFCLAALTYVRLLAMGDELLLREDIDKMPLRISQKLNYRGVECYASENLEVVTDEVGEIRKDVLAKWDKMLK